MNWAFIALMAAAVLGSRREAIAMSWRERRRQRIERRAEFRLRMEEEVAMLLAENPEATPQDIKDHLESKADDYGNPAMWIALLAKLLPLLLEIFGKTNAESTPD